MVETHQIQLNVKELDDEESVPPQATANACRPPTASQTKSLKWWIQVLFYSFLILAGQSTAVLLKRLYFEKGGHSKWMATLVQVAGFPVLLPFYYIYSTKNNRKDRDYQQTQSTKPSVLKLGLWYTSLGLLIAFSGILYSIGILYLPLSTLSLITASKLSFTALFAFVLNGQKFTPCVVNSLVVLSISTILLIFNNDSSYNNVTKAKYATGFFCAVGTSATSGLMLPLTQYFFQKVVKEHSIEAVLEMIVYEFLIASCAAVVGLFASGEWKTLKAEMQVYISGEVSYLMTLIWIAVSWQVCYIGRMKLLVKVSSLFSQVISTVGLPIVPVLAVFLFHDKMDGTKFVALVMAIWGFVSYAYQCYLYNQRGKPIEEAKH